MPFKKFRYDRSVVQKLASSKAMQNAMQEPAEKLADRFRAADPEARPVLTPVVSFIAKANRAGIRLTDEGKDSTKREFGTSRTPAKRTLGRLTGGTP